MENKISIIIPVHNSEKTIEKCIDSAINQTYKKIEIILVVNGSTDNSKYICDKYASIDSRIKVFELEKGSVSIARNYGKDNCTGDFFTFIDSDDWLDFSYCEKMLSKLLNKQVDMVFCNIQYLLDFIPVATEEVCLDFFLEKKLYYCFLAQSRMILGSSCRILYRKNVFSKVCFREELKIMEDLTFLYDCLSVSDRNCLLNEKLYFCNQLSTTPFIKKYYDSSFLNNCETLAFLLSKKLELFGFSKAAKAEFFSFYSLALAGIINNADKSKLKEFKHNKTFNEFNNRESYVLYKKLYCKSLKSKIAAFLQHYKIYFILSLYAKLKNRRIAKQTNK